MTNLKLSKTMALVLRHKPEAFGVTLDKQGKVSLSNLASSLKVSVKEIIEIVEQDDKGRFVIEKGFIWAAQGHSIKVDTPLESFVTDKNIFHGTKTKVLPLIKVDGLKPQSRSFVHLSKDEETAWKVASRRNGTSVLLVISGKLLQEKGIELFVSSNGVILSKSIPWSCVVDLIFES